MNKKVFRVRATSSNPILMLRFHWIVCLDALRETVEEYARVKMAPIELTAAFAIGCHSVSLAKGVTIMTNYGEPTYPNLQIYGSAWSGIGKSVCILLQRPINEFETESREKFRMQVIEEIREQRSSDQAVRSL